MSGTYAHIQDNERGREGEGKREIFHPLIHFPTVGSSQSWVMPKLGVRDSVQAPVSVAGTQALESSHVASH